MLRSKKALISVSNKAGIADFVGELLAMGWDIIASPGTARVLREAGYGVTDMQEITQIPTILDHRVFSEHIKIAGALVAEPTKSHDRDRAQYGIPWFDLLCVDLYPLSEAIARGQGEQDLIDSTDIGGITLIRNAVKGRRIVITDPADGSLVIEHLKRYGDVPEEVRRELRAKAELLCAKYCLDSARYISRDQIDGFVGVGAIDLCYGENPYQSPASYYDCGSEDALSMTKFSQVAGEKPSYVNLTSLDAIVGVLSRLSAAFATNYGSIPYVAIGAKHGLPVGASTDWDVPESALEKMLWGDPGAIWGGEVITNFPISERLVGFFLSDPTRKKKLGTGSWMLDLLAAPDFDERSIHILGERGKRRVFRNPALSNPPPSAGPVYRNVRGGFIKQAAATYILKAADLDWVGEPLVGAEFDTLLLSWAIAWSMHANGIALARDRQLLGCDGQPSSVGAIQSAVLKMRNAGHEPTGAFFAANAFLPFTDSAELLANSGCIGGVLPKGGRNEPSVRAYFAGRQMRVAFIPEAYRGFSRH